MIITLLSKFHSCCMNMAFHMQFHSYIWRHSSFQHARASPYENVFCICLVLPEEKFCKMIPILQLLAPKRSSVSCKGKLEAKPFYSEHTALPPRLAGYLKTILAGINLVIRYNQSSKYLYTIIFLFENYE